MASVQVGELPHMGTAHLALTKGSAHAGQFEPGNRQVAPEWCGEWRLHPQTGQIFGRVEVSFFALEDNSHCSIFFSNIQIVLAYK